MKRQSEKQATRRSFRIASRAAKLDINKFPPEILDSIIAQLDHNSLQNARLVNKTWRSPATKHLFRSLAFLPTKHGLKRWRCIIRHTTLRDMPRQAIVYTAPVPHFKSWQDWNPFNSPSNDPKWRAEYAIMEDWLPDLSKRKYKNLYSEINSLSMLPNLQHAYLHFTPNCVSESFDFDPEGTENPEFRIDLLTRFFEALKARQYGSNLCKVQKLTIRNLQDKPIPEFTSSALFKLVMQHVQHLNLMMTQQSYDGYRVLNKQDVYIEERRTFIPYLEDHWLKPWSHLKSLALYFPDFWGPLPAYFSGENLEFPSLEALTLGHYCLAHNHSLDWVLRQKSIKTFRLHDCVILSYSVLEKADLQSWNVLTHDWSPSPHKWYPFANNAPSEKLISYYFPGTWENVFDCIRTSLTNLVDFRFHIEKRMLKGIDIPEPYYFEDMSEATFDTPELLTTWLSPRRYVCFDIGNHEAWVPTECDGWLRMGNDPEDAEMEEYDAALAEGREYTGTRILNRHIQTKEGDGRALNDLLKTISERSRAYP